jgi:hypothetical protein
MPKTRSGHLSISFFVLTNNIHITQLFQLQSSAQRTGYGGQGRFCLDAGGPNRTPTKEGGGKTKEE